MLTCVLNAAEGQLDIILGRGDEIIQNQTWSTPAKGPIRGAEILVPALNSLFSLCKCSANDIERFACVHGPGSFTGVRLVLGTVSAIRRVTKAQNAAIDFMQALALSAKPLLGNSSSIWVLTHARRNMVHCQEFNLDEQVTAKNDVKLCSLEEVLVDFKSVTTNSFVLGSGYLRNKDYFDANMPKNLQALEIISPSAQALWQLALQAPYHSEDIEPLYIRPCDAIDNLDHIAKKQGMEPTFAHARLEELLKSKNF